MSGNTPIIRSGLVLGSFLICPYRGLPGVVDGVCLLLVIGSSGVDQGGVGGLGTPPSGRAWSKDHFLYL